ncbi:MAG: AsmA-like C-terminal region-containing protein [Luteolibacter sp.]
MYRLHLTRNLRTLWVLLVTAAVLTGLASLIWANVTGMPRTWRVKLEEQLAKQGTHVHIRAIRYFPLRGLVADDVDVFADAEKTRKLSTIGRIILDFEKTKLARGDIRVTKLELNKANVQLPVDPANPDSRFLEVKDVSGTVLMPGGRILDVRNATGMVAGIRITLNAQMLGYRQDGPPTPEDPDQGKRRELLAKIVDELEQWHFHPRRPPSIQIKLEGDLTDRSTYQAKMALRIPEIGKNGYAMRDITATARLEGDLLTLTSFQATDDAGRLNGHVDYDIKNREGRFDVSSSLSIPPLLEAWLGLPGIQGVVVRGNQKVEAEGEFHVKDDGAPFIRSTGHIQATSINLKGVDFDTLSTSYSWRDGNLYLRDLKLTRKDGRASGKALIQPPLFRMALHTTFPPHVYRPFFKGEHLDHILADFGQLAGATTDVTLEGGHDMTRDDSWEYKGHGTVKNTSFRGIPFHSANCSFTLNHHELDFYQGTAVFDYGNYGLRKTYDGPVEGTAKVGRIRYDAEKHVVEVNGVEGSIWAAPLVRLFAPDIANSLEIYRFHRPPAMKGDGIVDVTHAGRTDLTVSFKSDHAAHYSFLGQDLKLERPSGKVVVRGNSVLVDPLKFGTFSGEVSGDFLHHGNNQLKGELAWEKISVPELARTYDFDIKHGEATGRIEFSLHNGRIATLNAKGLLSLDKAELFSVPLFGPLTTLTTGLLGEKHGGLQRARSAFFTFEIKNGILTSNDFHTSTNSLIFTGDGTVNLVDRTIDMTMRMNARGLLGLITLPLRPFYGLFQFHGTGPLKKPTWESEIFTSPPEQQNKVLLDPPKARAIPEE